MKAFIILSIFLLLSLQADIKTSSGKSISTDNLGVVNIELVWYNFARAVASEKGVLDFIKQMRKNPSKRKPFSEWVLVYFDKTQISEEKILKIVQKRCPSAFIARDKEVKIGSSSLTVLNPYVSDGDNIAIKIISDGSKKIELTLPKGWTCEMPDKISGTEIIYVKTDTKSAKGKYELNFKSGTMSAKLKCHIVKRVK